MPRQHHHSLIHPVDAHAVRQPDHKLIVRHPPEKLHAQNLSPGKNKNPYGSSLPVRSFTTITEMPVLPK